MKLRIRANTLRLRLMRLLILRSLWVCLPALLRAHLMR